MGSKPHVAGPFLSRISGEDALCVACGRPCPPPVRKTTFTVGDDQLVHFHGYLHTGCELDEEVGSGQARDRIGEFGAVDIGEGAGGKPPRRVAPGRGEPRRGSGKDQA